MLNRDLKGGDASCGVVLGTIACYNKNANKRSIFPFKFQWHFNNSGVYYVQTETLKVYETFTSVQIVWTNISSHLLHNIGARARHNKYLHGGEEMNYLAAIIKLLEGITDAEMMKEIFRIIDHMCSSKAWRKVLAGQLLARFFILFFYSIYQFLEKHPFIIT